MEGNRLNRAPSDNLDNLLLTLAKLEIKDFVGIDINLAKKLIMVNNQINAMLDWEIKSRTINTFMPPLKQPHRGDSGAYPNG